MVLQQTKPLMADKLMDQEEILVVSQGNHVVHSFATEEDAHKWLDKRSQKPGVHPTVRFVKRIVQHVEL